MPPKATVPPRFKTRKAAIDQFAGGGKDQGGVQFRGRLVEGSAAPHGAEFARQVAVPLVAREGVDLDVPVPRHLNGHVRGRAKPVHAQRATGLDAGNPQRAEPDDAGAEQRGKVQSAGILGQSVDEILVGGHVFGITAIHHPAGEDGPLAEVFAAGAAKLAHAAGMVQPGHSHAGALLEAGGARPAPLHHADYLVARDQGRFALLQLALHHVQVGAANPAGLDADQHLAGSNRGIGVVAEA